MMRRLQHASRGRFGIGFLASTIYGKLPEVIRRFRATRPGVDVALVEFTGLEQIVALKENRINFRIRVYPTLMTRRSRDSFSDTSERLVVALSVDSPLLAAQGPVAIDDLTREPLIA